MHEGHSTNLPRNREDLTYQIFDKLNHTTRIVAYPASKKYKKYNNPEASSPKISIPLDEAARILELLRDKNNYRWDMHKKTVFIPSIGYKVYFNDEDKIDVVYSFSAKQLRFSFDKSFITLDCDAIAPELKRIADRILEDFDASEKIEFDN